MYTLEEIKDYSCLRSKNTLITVGVGGTWVNPPSLKKATFFYRFLALSLRFRHLTPFDWKIL